LGHRATVDGLDDQEEDAAIRNLSATTKDNGATHEG
jgi:hypothetical protein